jgi:hypothetical protein
MKMPGRSRTLFAVGTALLVAGCASSGPGGAADVVGNSDVITEEELRAASVADLYQAVERLRPLWLRSRGQRSFNTPTEIAVIRDNVYFGPLETLRSIPAQTVVRLERVDGSTAASLIPGVINQDRNIEAAILVFHSRPPR